MLPDVLRPSKFGIPIAELTINGLGICFFNRENKAWEIAFIGGTHYLILTVREVDKSGRIISERVSPPLNKLKVIRFELSNGSEAHYKNFREGFYKAPTKFSRKGSDSYDFKWVIDLLGGEVPHGAFNGLKPSSEVTVVVVPHSLFYTKRVASENVVFAPLGRDADHGQVFGRTNELAGAGIFASTPGGVLKITDDNGHSVVPGIDEMPITPGHMYDISMVNQDDTKTNGTRQRSLSGVYTPGDFDQFYNVLDVAEPKYQIHAPRRGGFRNAEGDCAVGRIGPGPVKTLMELIQP